MRNCMKIWKQLITAEHTKEIEAFNPQDSFRKLSWEQQKIPHHLKLSLCDGTLYLLSGGVFIFDIYQCLPMICFRNLAVLSYLRRRLYVTTHIIATTTNIGFVDKQLLRMASISKEMNKYVGLVLD